MKFYKNFISFLNMMLQVILCSGNTEKIQQSENDLLFLHCFLSDDTIFMSYT